MKKLTQKDFLEKTPLGEEAQVMFLVSEDDDGDKRFARPDIELECDICQGPRNFRCTTQESRIIDFHLQGDPDRNEDNFDEIVKYRCKNCEEFQKVFSIACKFDYSSGEWTELKYGEFPKFGFPLPSKAVTLIGPDRDNLLKGRQCEIQGFGMGAFTYYRRVVENQKTRIFNGIIRVGKHLSVDAALISELEAGKKEIQFTKAVDVVRQALPQAIMINNANPLTLLHSALSEGIHELDDKECLELATNIRLVLVEFAERLSQAMKDQTELNNAVTKLANRAKKQS